MLKKFTFFMSLCLALSVFGCAENDDNTGNENNNTGNENNNTGNETSEPVWLFDSLSDEDKAKLPIQAVKTIEGIGQWATDIELFEDYAYVVDSTNNVIHRIKLDDLTLEKNYVDLGQNAAPYAAHADDKALYVAVSGKNAVIKFPHDDVTNPVTVADNFIAPTAMYARDGKLYIADSEYDYSDASKTGGKVYVYDETGKTAELVTTSQNPGFLEYCPMYDWLFSINAGVVSFYPETTAPEKSCIDVWEVKNLKSDGETKPLHTFCAEGANLGRAVKNKGTLYVGDGLKPVVYAIGIEEINKPEAALKTIEITKEETGLTIPIDMGEYLGVAEFSSDMLYLIQGDQKMSFRLSKKDASAKKNPMDAVYDTKRKQVLILNSNAGTVDILKVVK